MTERLKLGELLVETGLITRVELDEALRQQKEHKRRLGEILVANRVIPEAKVTQVLSQQMSIPWVSLAHIDFSRALLDLVPADCAQKYGVVPIYVRRGKNHAQTLYVAMQDPTEVEALEEISRFSGLPVRPMIAPPSDVQGAIRAYYLGLPPLEVSSQEAPTPVVERGARSDPLAETTRPARPAAPPVSASAPATVPAPVSARPRVIESIVPDAEEPDDVEESAPPESARVVESRASHMPRPKQASKAQKMVTLTLLDGTQITLPASSGKTRGEPSEPSSGLTARDLIEALRAQADGTDASEVLGEHVNWERMFSALLSLLLKKHLIHDWEFVRELKR